MNFLNWIYISKPIKASPIGWIFFQIGLFFLPSSAFLGGLFLVISLIRANFRNTIFFFTRDIWNYPLILASFIMLAGTFDAYSGWLAWIGLVNWLPFFWVFWSARDYLSSSLSRKKSTLILLFGSVPVFITGFGQIWLGWSGPWEIFDGLIVWFVASGGQPLGRLSGLFDYANIAGSWLSIVWPISLATVLEPFQGLSKRVISICLAVCVVSSLIMTSSRNAWVALTLSIPFVIGPAQWYWLLPLFLFSLLPVIFSVLPNVHPFLQEWSRKIIPESIWSRLNDMQYADERVLEGTRLNQWKVALKLITERPWLGWGAAAFSVLYPLREGLWHGHSHNLPLELAVSHGLLVMFLIVGLVLSLLVVSMKKCIFFKSSNHQSILFDRAWWTSTFVLVFLHGADMPLFDGRINLVGWILLSGLRCMILPDQLLNKKEHNAI